MTNAEVRQIHELKEEGYSLREIAKETGIPKSTVERALKMPLSGSDDPDDDDTDDDELELDEQEDDEEEKSFRVLPTPVQSAKTGRANVPARRAEATPASMMAQAAMVELAAQREARQAEQQRIEDRKQWFVDKANRLLRELLKSAGETVWDEEEADAYILRVDTLKEKLGKFCEKHAIDEEDLHIWATLTELQDFMEDHMADNRPWFGSEVTFELSKAAIRSWKDKLIDSFDDEAYEDDDQQGEEVDDESEPGDDDDE